MKVRHQHTLKDRSEFLELGEDLVRDFLHLRRLKAQLLVREIQVLFALHRNKMDMGVIDFQAQYSLTDLDAGESGLDGASHLLGENLETANLVVFHVKNVIHLTTGNDLSPKD